jgi:hypothetical protein
MSRTNNNDTMYYDVRWHSGRPQTECVAFFGATARRASHWLGGVIKHASFLVRRGSHLALWRIYVRQAGQMVPVCAFIHVRLWTRSRKALWAVLHGVQAMPTTSVHRAQDVSRVLCLACAMRPTSSEAISWDLETTRGASGRAGTVRFFVRLDCL